MDEEYQRMAAHSIAHEAFCAGQAWQQAAAAQERPCVLWKPRLFRDGNQWCALFGENIQEGVVGFGDSPDAAMWAFDEAWREKLPPAPDTQPASSDEYVGWYCAHCERGVDASEVTYHEQHEVCGRVITDDRPPKSAPSVPDGWKLVPIEPTPTMVKAGLESSHVLNVHRVLACYDAMIDAAPEAKP